MARNATKAKSSRKASDKAAADVPAVDDDLLLEFYPQDASGSAL